MAAIREILFVFLLYTVYGILYAPTVFAAWTFDAIPPTLTVTGYCFDKNTQVGGPTTLSNGSNFPCNGDTIRLDIACSSSDTDCAAAFATVDGTSSCKYFVTGDYGCSSTNSGQPPYNVWVKPGKSVTNIYVVDTAGNQSNPQWTITTSKSISILSPTPANICNSGCTGYIDGNGNPRPTPNPQDCTGNTYLVIYNNSGGYSAPNACGYTCGGPCLPPNQVSADRCKCILPTPTPTPPRPGGGGVCESGCNPGYHCVVQQVCQ